MACNLQPSAHAGSSFADFSTRRMEAMLSSETSAHTRFTLRHIPEDAAFFSIKIYRNPVRNAMIL
jgi:hypothetical protein